MADLFQEETGQEVSRNRVSEIVDETSKLPDSSTITIEQEAEATGRCETNVYRQRKLQKTSPDLYAQVQSGQKTLNAACVAAGIVRKPGPMEQILKLLPKLSQEEIAELKKKISELGIKQGRHLLLCPRKGFTTQHEKEIDKLQEVCPRDCRSVFAANEHTNRSPFPCPNQLHRNQTTRKNRSDQQSKQCSQRQQILHTRNNRR